MGRPAHNIGRHIMPEDNGLTVEILQRLARIEEALKSEPQRCAYREQIARATNNVERLRTLETRVDAVETHVTDVRISLAKMLAVGGSGGILGALVLELVKALPNLLP